MVKQDQVIIQARINKELADEVKQVVKGKYLNESEFLRAAIREKLFKEQLDKVGQDYAKTKDSKMAFKALSAVEKQMTFEEYLKWVEEGSRDMPRRP